MMTPDQQFEYFLRKAAIHEAGHLVVHRHFGGDGYIRLEMNLDGDLRDEVLVLGRMHMFERPDPDAAQLIGLAGLCAECMDDDPETTGYEVYDYIEAGVIELSGTDALHARGYQIEHMEAVVRILRDQWQEVLRYAGYEIEKYTRRAA